MDVPTISRDRSQHRLREEGWHGFNDGGLTAGLRMAVLDTFGAPYGFWLDPDVLLLRPLDMAQNGVGLRVTANGTAGLSGASPAGSRLLWAGGL